MASHLIAQITLIALHIDFAVLMYYFESEVGTMVANWIADMGYLAIRLTLRFDFKTVKTSQQI